MHVSEIMDLATGYWKSAALMAAIELDLFSDLAEGPVDPAVAAEKRGASSAYTAELLDALAGLGVLVKSNGLYTVTAELKNTLDPAHPQNLVSALRFNADTYALWGKLAQCVREGKPVINPDAHLGDDPGRTRRFVEAMHSRARLFAPLFVQAIDLKGRRRLLDVGCGPGTFSHALAETNDKLNITLFDLPPILDVARSLHPDHPAADRIQTHPGDYHTDALPAGFDAVLYSGALHQESTQDARELLDKIFQSLEPGGRLCLVDLMLHDDRTQPVFSVLFSIQMKLCRPSGQVYTVSDALALCDQAGFSGLEQHTIPHTPYIVITGEKSA